MRSPDVVLEFATTARSGAVSGCVANRNPLHADPDIARAPALKRLFYMVWCTTGSAVGPCFRRSVNTNRVRLKSHSVRFSGPGISGDVITVKLWRDGVNVSFEAEVAARKSTVIRAGGPAYSEYSFEASNLITTRLDTEGNPYCKGSRWRGVPGCVSG